MKNPVRKILFLLFLILFAAGILQAQPVNFKNLITEVEAIQKQLVPDKRVAILTVTLTDTLLPTVILKGETTLPEGKKRILQAVESRGIQFVDSVRVFPDPSLGDKTWALVTLSVVHMRSQPDHAAEMVSQALMGTPLKVLEHRDGWYRVQSPDQYLGWIEGNGLVRFTQSEIDRWKQSARYVFYRMKGHVFDSPGRKASEVSDLVMGDLIEVEADQKGFLKIRLPDGRTGFVRKTDCLSWDEWTNRKPDVKTVISVGKQMLGTPYLWGGTSTAANDCSGFTKTCYFSQAIILARDASQQARYGEHPDFSQMQALQPGDLLFFGPSARRVTHVGLYMGNGKYIHSSGYVRINSIDPNDPAFNLNAKRNLVAAARILNMLNTDGITQVKNHPWYSVKN